MPTRIPVHIELVLLQAVGIHLVWLGSGPGHQDQDLDDVTKVLVSGSESG